MTIRASEYMVLLTHFCMTSFLSCGGIVVTVETLCERLHRISVTVSQWTDGRQAGKILQALQISLVDACSIEVVEVIIRLIVRQLPTNHGGFEFQGSCLTTRPPLKELPAHLAHQVRYCSHIMVYQLYSRVNFVEAHHKIFDIFPVLWHGLFIVGVMKTSGVFFAWLLRQFHYSKLKVMN